MRPARTTTATCAMTAERRKPDHRDAEEREADVLDEWSEWRVGNESPVEMACVGEELKLIAMEAVATVGEEMKDRDGSGDGERMARSDLRAATGEESFEGDRRTKQSPDGFCNSCRDAVSGPLRERFLIRSRGGGTRTEAMPAAVAP